RRAGIKAAHARGDDSRVGRAAAQMTEHGEGELDEIVAGAGLLQNAAEQHEQEDHRGRDADGGTEDTLELHPVMPHGLAIGSTLALDGVGDESLVAKQDVAHEYASDDTEREAERAARAGTEGGRAAGGPNQVPVSRQAGPAGDLVLEHAGVEPRADPRGRQ